MKAGKKMQAKMQHRSIQHNAALDARRRKGISEPTGNPAFRAPGSMNKKKLGVC